MLNPTLVLCDNVTIINEIPHPFVGRTFLGVDQRTNNQVICKMIPHSLFKCAQEQQRFVQRIRKLNDLKLDFVVPFVTIGVHHENMVFVRPFIKHPSLGDLIKTSSPLDSEVALSIFQKLCGCFAILADYGFSPCSIHPNNIFLLSQTKFLITDLFEPSYDFLNNSNHVDKFRFAYLAPEYIDGSQKPGPHSDVWTLAIILFVMCKGDFPWTMNNMCKMFNQITKDPQPDISFCEEMNPIVLSIIRNCLVHDTAKRAMIDNIVTIEPPIEPSTKLVRHSNIVTQSQIITQLPKVIIKQNANTMRRSIPHIIAPSAGKLSYRKRVAPERSLTIQNPGEVIL